MREEREVRGRPERQRLAAALHHLQRPREGADQGGQLYGRSPWLDLLVLINIAVSGAGSCAIAFFLLTLLPLAIGMLVSRKVYATKITKDCACLGGCKEPFLASLE